LQRHFVVEDDEEDEDEEGEEEEVNVDIKMYFGDRGEMSRAKRRDRENKGESEGVRGEEAEQSICSRLFCACRFHLLPCA